MTSNETQKPPLEFQTMQQAFDYCREADRPVIVRIAGQLCKLFPSGKSRTVSGAHLTPNAPAAHELV